MKATKVAQTSLPTPYGTFRLFGYESTDKSESVIALVMGNVGCDDPVLLRIHSQCLTGDVFGSGRCDCGDQLHFALEKIASRGAGVLIYQLQEGRGIGLMNKLLAYELQDSGQDTVEANQHLGFEPDHRNYALCADVLRHLGVSRVRLMSNNPNKHRNTTFRRNKEVPQNEEDETRTSAQQSLGSALPQSFGGT
jgi:GTP cyclohydrolase II